MSPQRLVVGTAVTVVLLGSLGANRTHRSAVRASRPTPTTRTANMPIRTASLNNHTGMSLRGTAGRSTGDGQSLVQAYQLLSTANHDYKGHRAKAMKSIRQAARMMGVRLSGEGKGGEQQTTSDQQLRQAQSMLQKMRGTVAGRNQAKVVQHVDQAIGHLSTALSIK